MADKDFRVKLGLHVGANAYIEGNITSVDQVQMNVASPAAVGGAGQFAWNIDENTLDLGMNANTTLQVGQEQYYYVKNVTGVTIPNRTVVMVAGTNGASGRIHIAPALANNSVPSKYIMGVTTEDIANGADGFVTAFGKIRDVDTSMFSEGDILYADPAVPGGLSNTAPIAPNNIVTVAFVVNKHASAGTLFVRPTYGSSVFEDEKAYINNIQDGQALVYSTANSRFENMTVSGTSSDSFKTISVAGQSNVVADSSTDILTFVGGSGITITTDAVTDTITFSSTGGGDVSNAWVNANDYATYTAVTSAFQANDWVTLQAAYANDYALYSSITSFNTISVAGQSNVVAGSIGSALTLIAGSGISITTNSTNDSITIVNTGGGGGASVTVNDSAPVSPSSGDLWFDSTDGTLNIYYDDSTSNQWVTTSGTAGLNGLGFTGGAYDSNTGVVTFTSNDGIGFSTSDIRTFQTGRTVAMAMIFG